MKVFLTFLLLAKSQSFSANAADRIITDHGVEIRTDEATFILFSALNALGYSEETKHLGPPLRAPVFHPARLRVRKYLERHVEAGALDQVRTFVDQNPGSVADYLSALRVNSGTQLASIQGVLRKLATRAQLEALFDRELVADRQRLVQLKRQLDKDFVAAKKKFAIQDLRAPESMIVISNALDGHEIAHSIRKKDELLLVLGPGQEAARTRILAESLRPLLKRMSSRAFTGANGYKKRWDKLKATKVGRRFESGLGYFAETLGRSAAHRVVSKKTGQGDNDFIASQVAEGLFWTQSALRIVDAHRPGTPFQKTLARLIARTTP